MAFTPDEKQMIKESLSLYIQYAGQQVAPAQMEQLTVVIKGIITKLDTVQSGDGETLKPADITDEWFNSVCATCEHLTPSGCDDPVTAKFPGKCDPILKFEMAKIQNKL